MPERQPTALKLAQSLTVAGAPPSMIQAAMENYYDDYKSDLAFPIVQLVKDATAEGLTGIAERAKNGEFDAQDWEADEWAASPDGQETFKEFGVKP